MSCSKNLMKNGSHPEIISASRRLDIRFHLDELFNHLHVGYIDVPNPRNKISYRVYFDNLKAIAWWSKNYDLLINQFKRNNPLLNKYVHYFNFTITGLNYMDGGIEDVDMHIDDIGRQLSSLMNYGYVNVRFDPIVHYRINGNYMSNIDFAIEFLFPLLGKLREERSLNEIRVVSSFCILSRRNKKMFADRNMELIEPTQEEKNQDIADLLIASKKYGIELNMCCDSIILDCENIPESLKSCDIEDLNDGLKNKNGCIDGNIINQMLKKKGDHLSSRKKDAGQRSNCNCVVSRDIGQYTKCEHKCLYCYANPDL